MKQEKEPNYLERFIFVCVIIGIAAFIALAVNKFLSFL